MSDISDPFADLHIKPSRDFNLSAPEEPATPRDVVRNIRRSDANHSLTTDFNFSQFDLRSLAESLSSVLLNFISFLEGPDERAAENMARSFRLNPPEGGGFYAPGYGPDDHADEEPAETPTPTQDADNEKGGAQTAPPSQNVTPPNGPGM